MFLRFVKLFKRSPAIGRHRRKGVQGAGRLGDMVRMPLDRLKVAGAIAAFAPMLLAESTTAAETGNLAALRDRALELVNAARSDHGLDSLEYTAPLNDAALAHARAMLEENFYSHVSPEGETVRDRFLENDGSRWKLVAENIARCSGCSTPPDIERVEDFHQGWMESPGHRENILSQGLEGFGFGIIGEGDEVYAVQTFAGPGVSRGDGPAKEPATVSVGEQVRIAVAAVNRARDRAGIGSLSSSAALDRVASELLARESDGERLVNETDNLFELLPEGETAEWRSLNIVAAGCGGCGSEETAADVRGFVQQWLDNPHYEQTLLAQSADAMGYAMHADGKGRKIAVAVTGSSR